MKDRNNYFIFGRRYSSVIKGVFCGLQEYGQIIVEFRDPNSILKLIFKNANKNQTYILKDPTNLQKINISSTLPIGFAQTDFEFKSDETRFDQKFTFTRLSQVIIFIYIF